MNETILYSYSELSRLTSVGSRKTWKNLILSEDYKNHFKIGGSNYGHTLYTTNLTVNELKNMMVEYKRNLQFKSLTKATKARMANLNLT
jgi:hypothetical protein